MKALTLRPNAAILLLALSAAAFSHEHVSSRAHYLGNEAVMVERGATKIVFDPLFREDYGQYQRVPADIEAALMAGTPPFDGVDAVFVSHYHDDHFDPALMLDYLEAQPAIELYGPEQAVAGLRAAAEPASIDVFERVHSLTPDYRGSPLSVEVDGLLIEAVHIPHAGWPDSRTDVQNIAFRVTLDGVTTVTHLGDADTDATHFDVDYWSKRPSHLALPPYWFFGTPEARRILDDTIGAAHSVGIHVPTNVPKDAADRKPPLDDADLFTRPGETRDIPGPGGYLDD